MCRKLSISGTALSPPPLSNPMETRSSLPCMWCSATTPSLCHYNKMKQRWTGSQLISYLPFDARKMELSTSVFACSKLAGKVHHRDSVFFQSLLSPAKAGRRQWLRLISEHTGHQFFLMFFLYVTEKITVHERELQAARQSPMNLWTLWPLPRTDPFVFSFSPSFK